MYDELIKNLRYDSASALQNCDFDFVHAWMLQAADAIEDLEKQLDEEVECYTALICNVPKWIPVTERLPEHSGFYIIFQVGGSYGQLSEIKIAYWDSHNFNGGMMTTHWMPIPEPPKNGEACDITNPFLTCYREKEFVVDFQQEHKHTNADRIRSMTDEELSYYLDGLAGDGCPPQMSPVCNKERYKCNVRKCWLDWLKRESEDDW